MLTIKTSGGFGGIAIPQETQIDLAALPVGEREAVCALVDRLNDADSAEAVHIESLSGGADRMTYEFVMDEADQAAPKRVIVPEASLSAQEIDLVDRLKSY